MTRVRGLLFLLTSLFVLGVGYAVIQIAKGYRFDTKTLTFRPSGLFVVTSSPDGAQVLVNGKLESATNATISLPPDRYEIELKKEGFLTWKKTITIKKEEVTKIDVSLFPAAPSLSALTFAGAVGPVLSEDGTKIAYGVPISEKADEEKVGIWVMELGDLPIGFSRDPRRVASVDPTDLSWAWSPDSRELLVRSSQGFSVLDVNSPTPPTALAPITSLALSETLKDWQEESDKKYMEKFEKLPKTLRDLLKNQKVEFSPDKNKVFYTAKAEFLIPEGLAISLPGSSTQNEERAVKSGNTYVYDLKEDKNFLVFSGELAGAKSLFEEASESAAQGSQKTRSVRVSDNLKIGKSDSPNTLISWFPTSNHLILTESGKILIQDYDGTNPQTVYAGPYTAPFAIPLPNTSRLLILTNLGAGGEVVGNLYAVSLR
ncbi:MAG: PEGA domain-containing protein [Patescibacteria group bacterium]